MTKVGGGCMRGDCLTAFLPWPLFESRRRGRYWPSWAAGCPSALGMSREYRFFPFLWACSTGTVA